MQLKPYRIQRTPLVPHDAAYVQRVDYQALVENLKLPVLWFYESYLQAWLPMEVSEDFLAKLRTGNVDPFCLELAVLCATEATQRPWEDLRAEFAATGLVAIPNLLHPPYAYKVRENFLRHANQRVRIPDLEGIKRTSINNLPLMRVIHQATENLVRFVTNDEIKTSYSFTARYERGTTLPRHIDRPQCVYNISMILGGEPAFDTTGWPFFIERPGKVHDIRLNPGDGVLYRGRTDYHWRPELPDIFDALSGSFLHYVPSNFDGPLD